MPDTREVPALWEHWQRLKQGLGVDWDILAFCTRDVLLPDGTRYGTLCLHHCEPRAFSADEQALLEVLARMLGLELWRERSAHELLDALAALDLAEHKRVDLADELQHELRAPLQVIDGYAEAMLDGVVSRDDEHVTLVRREAGRAIQLLEDLADLVHIEVGVDDGRRRRARVDAIAAEMRDRLAPLAESAGIELVADVAPAEVVIPRKRLEQLVVNLVRNALRAVQAGDGSRIVIFVRPEGGLVAVGVEDDGPGMAADQLPRAFERFYRGSSARGGRERQRPRADDRAPDRPGRRRRDRRRERRAPRPARRRAPAARRRGSRPRRACRGGAGVAPRGVRCRARRLPP